jgi:hypothetical protein
MKKGCFLALTLAIVFGAGISFAQPRGELVICQGAEVNALDPAKHNSIPDTNFGLHVFDMLYLRDNQESSSPISRCRIKSSTIRPGSLSSEAA